MKPIKKHKKTMKTTIADIYKHKTKTFKQIQNHKKKQ